MAENDYGRPGPAEHPAYYYLPCVYCDGEFPPDSGHDCHEEELLAQLSGVSDPMEQMPEGWLGMTPELEQEMTEFYERLDEDRLEDC
jgi:hypothetical protein